ncbi:MAG: phytoene desaturase [Bacteroidales bacterium]|nr:phytoene desaturase [Bacteroidales bacterium]MBN2817426.1 phytoene desaturase [Bacteroidales bacterium]
MASKAIVLGSGFSGLSSAAYLAKHGFKVDILEQCSTSGGRARRMESHGFTFDMGPSWYWMPEIFEKFFLNFGYQTSDFYKLKRLDPSYRMFFAKDNYIDIPSKPKELYQLFESIEKGSSKKLKKFLADAHRKYAFVMKNAVYKPGFSALEYLDLRLLTGLFYTKSVRSLSSYVRSLFKEPRLMHLLEFPVLFLGASKDIPALYTLMNYADLKLGTWYPQGGMYKIVEAMLEICRKLDVEITYNVKVDQLDILKNKVIAAHSGHRNFYADYFVSSADYQYTDRQMLPAKFSNYSEKYWDSRVLAPSALTFFIGVNKKLPKLLHHNLFFEADTDYYAEEIYKKPVWPESPAMYVSVSSKSDPSTAPEGSENLVVLIPVAPNLEDHGRVREYYFDMLIGKLESYTGTSIRENIVYHRSYAHSDFIKDYNSYKGNAFGLANTLKQSGIFKPKIKNKNLPNLFYTGQFTVPGPGVPFTIISGEIVAQQVFKASGGYKN